MVFLYLSTETSVFDINGRCRFWSAKLCFGYFQPNRERQCMQIVENVKYIFSLEDCFDLSVRSRLSSIKLFPAISLVLVSAGVFLFGALIVCIFIDSIKLITGYQRPYFLTLCNITRPCDRFNHSPTTSPEAICQTRSERELRYAW